MIDYVLSLLRYLYTAFKLTPLELDSSFDTDHIESVYKLYAYIYV